MNKKNTPKILLTGACGFVGSNIASRLIEIGHAPFLLDDCSFGNPVNIGNNPFYKMDFNDLTSDELKEYDVLIHCATSNIIYAMDKPIETFQNNATNTIRLFQKFNGKIIYTSTASVYGQAKVLPTPEDADILTNNSYDQSKYIAELYLQQRGNYTTLRLSNVYGTNQRADNPYCGVIGKLVHGILNGEVIKINGSGTQTRDYSFIDDVVDAIIITIEKEALNTEINIATGSETSILDLCTIISNQARIIPIMSMVENRKIDGITRRFLDIRKADKMLGWKPQTQIEDGIKKTISWMQNSKW